MKTKITVDTDALQGSTRRIGNIMITELAKGIYKFFFPIGVK